MTMMLMMMIIMMMMIIIIIIFLRGWLLQSLAGPIPISFQHTRQEPQLRYNMWPVAEEARTHRACLGLPSLARPQHASIGKRGFSTPPEPSIGNHKGRKEFHFMLLRGVF